MKHIKITIIVLFVLLTFVELHAQETLSAAGGEAKGSDGSSSYTVGQVFYTKNTGTNGSESQGVQQPFSISTTIGASETEISLDFIIHPNPTNGALKLNIGNYNNNKLTYQLFSLKGELLDSKSISETISTINMVHFPPSPYLLKVLDGKLLVKTFKIIKN